MKDLETIVLPYVDSDIDAYREEVGILSEDLLRTDINPYFEED
jgi:hypothetical protein